MTTKTIKTGTEIEYLGHTIKRFKADGIVLIGPAPHNRHRGNFGTNLELAKGYALMWYMLSNPTMVSSIVSRLACSTDGGYWGDHSLLAQCLTKDGYDEVIPRTKDTNRMIDFKAIFNRDKVKPNAVEQTVSLPRFRTGWCGFHQEWAVYDRAHFNSAGKDEMVRGTIHPDKGITEELCRELNEGDKDVLERFSLIRLDIPRHIAQ